MNSVQTARFCEKGSLDSRAPLERVVFVLLIIEHKESSSGLLVEWECEHGDEISK